MSIRRSRFLIQAQVSPRFMIISHWGINNQSFINGGGPPAHWVPDRVLPDREVNVRNYICMMPGRSLL
jgi:hypothetical protein